VVELSVNQKQVRKRNVEEKEEEIVGEFIIRKEEISYYQK